MSSSSRLQCILAEAGVDSRRHCASIIAGGAVTVDGTIVREPGFRVEHPETADIRVSGKPIRVAAGGEKSFRTILLNKPRGLACTKDDSFGPTVYDLLKGVKERVVSAGRLDKDSDGLLVLSNDGNLVNELTHPRFNHTKSYRVQTAGLFDDETLRTLQAPMTLEDGYVAKPVRVEYLERLKDGPLGPRHRLLFTLREGRNRQIRQMCEQVGLRIESLTRVSINRLHLPTDLKSGAWRDVTEKEMALLRTIDTKPLRPWRPGPTENR